MKRTILLIVLIIAAAVAISWSVIWRRQQPAPFVTPPLSASIKSQPTFSPVTLDTIFGDKRPDLTKADPAKLVTILATGDVVPGRSVNYQATKFNDFTWSWKNVADFTKAADLTYINFEVPLVVGCPVTNEGMNFCGDPKQVQGLDAGGVDVANLANNHSGDHGTAGITSTQKILGENGISFTGTGQILYKEVKGVKFAFLGFNDITSVVNPAPATTSAVVDLVKEARAKSDVVIVGFHWGVEYTSQPTTRQKELAHLAIDSGADLILGNHPHWIQPVEIYKGKVITYAHGNFIFDQMWSPETEQGVVGKYTFYENQLVDVNFTPIGIRDYGQAFLQEGTASAKILTTLKNNSLILSHEPVL